VNEKFAKVLADIVGGRAVNVGGGIFIVEIGLRGTLNLLGLGKYGWWIEDADGQHTMDSDNVESW